MIHFLMCKEISSVILPIIYLTLTNIYETMRFKVTSMIWQHFGGINQWQYSYDASFQRYRKNLYFIIINGVFFTKKKKRVEKARVWVRLGNIVVPIVWGEGKRQIYYMNRV